MAFETTSVGAAGAVSAALERAQRHLLGLQRSEGWWRGEFETCISAEALDLMTRAFLGRLRDDLLQQTAAWIRSRQDEDGSWAAAYGSPGDLSVTIEGYLSLRMAGDPIDAAHMRRAREFILDNGGLERARMYTTLCGALFGLCSWDDVPAVPPEIIFLPKWAPLNIYDYASWVRSNLVPLTLLWAHRPSRPLGFRVDELRTGGGRPPLRPVTTLPGLFERFDTLLHGYERHPLKRLRRLALARAERWLLDRQEADGTWGVAVYSAMFTLIALGAHGYSLDHPVIARGLDGLEPFIIVEGGQRRVEVSLSTMWDTGLAVNALLDAGTTGDDPAVVAATEAMARHEVRVKGDWAVRRPDLEPGAWAFQAGVERFPDLDDTATVVRALTRAGGRGGRFDQAVRRGTAWAAGMQNRDGGWGSFDVDNHRRLCERLPFADYGEIIDPSTADLTAHVVEMLGDAGLADHPATRRGVRWLLANQEADGSWFGRWGVNHLYGTGQVLPALAVAGVDPGDARVRAAVRWLESHQNPDGGWGEDSRSYHDPAWRGRGASTPSQTAWALLGLLAVGERGEAVERGVAWLLGAQRPDGAWDEQWFTGTGMPGVSYIRYDLYRIVFPVMALGRYLGTAPAQSSR